MESEENSIEEEKIVLHRKIDDLFGRMSKRNMPQVNIEALQAWINFMMASGANLKTVLKNLYCISGFITALPQGTTLKDATREQIESAMAKVESSNYSGTTKANIKVITKSFYKHYLGEDLYYPRQIAWVKAPKSRKKMLPEDILSETEVLKLIEITSNMRDKAIIALLFDSGIRVGELLSLRKKSVELTGEIAHIIVDGKTGMRRIPIVFSAPYLTNYLETVRRKKAGDYLWTGIGTWTASNKIINGSAVRKLLRIAGKKAGIDKRMYPHLFRHSRATYYANRITEQQLKAFFGWTGDSTMVSTYVHMSGRDIDNAILQVHGKQIPEVIAPKLTEKICPRCRYANGIDFIHCKQCGAPLDIGTLLKSEEVTERLKSAMIDSLDDPEFRTMMQKYVNKKEKAIIKK